MKISMEVKEPAIARVQRNSGAGRWGWYTSWGVAMLPLLTAMTRLVFVGELFTVFLAEEAVTIAF